MFGAVVWDIKGEEGCWFKDGRVNVWWINICWARNKQGDPERNFNKQTLLGPSSSTHRVHAIVICGYSSRSRTSPLATFFKRLRGQSFFLGLLDINCFQLKTVHMTKRHFGVISFAPLELQGFLTMNLPGHIAL